MVVEYQTSVSTFCFDLEVDGTVHNRRNCSAVVEQLWELLCEQMNNITAPTTTFQTQLLKDVRRANALMLLHDGLPTPDIGLLAVKLQQLGYSVSLRSAVGGGRGTQCFHNLRNHFLVVAGERDAFGTQFIVENNLLDHFIVPVSTPRYTLVCDLLPSELVATADQLTDLVNMISSEMALAFDESDVTLPPWRQAKSILSKWLPKKYNTVMCSPDCSPRADSPTGARSVFSIDTTCSSPTTPGGYTINNSGCGSPSWWGEEQQQGDDNSTGILSPRTMFEELNSFFFTATKHDVVSPQQNTRKSLLSEEFSRASSARSSVELPASDVSTKSSKEMTPKSSIDVEASAANAADIHLGWDNLPIRTVKLMGAAF